MLYKENDIVAVNDIHNETVGIGIIVDRPLLEGHDEKYCVRFNSGNPIAINRRSIKKLYTLRGYVYEGFADTMRDIIRRLGRGTYMNEQEFGKYQDEWLKSRSDSSPSRPYSRYAWRYDPKLMDNMYPVKSSLKALGELNRKEVERIAASPIRIDIDDAIKANYSKEEIKEMVNKTFRSPVYIAYNKIIFNGPCTIILWSDGTKTMAKTSKTDAFDPEKGVAICFMKKILGHTETNKILRKSSKDFYDELTKEVEKDLDIITTPPKFNFEDAVKNTLDSIKSSFSTNVDISSVIKGVKRVEDEERAKEAVNHAPDAIKYHLYTGEEIKVSADKNIGEIFFDDTKEEDNGEKDN